VQHATFMHYQMLASYALLLLLLLLCQLFSSLATL
jgi:hypothetical protein